MSIKEYKNPIKAFKSHYTELNRLLEETEEKLAEWVLELELTTTAATLKTIEAIMVGKMSLLTEYMEVLYNLI